MKPKSRHRGLTVFVTVGSTKFDKLINKVISNETGSQLIELGFNRLILQVGESSYDKSQVETLQSDFNLDIEIYKYKSSILEDIERADVVVGHGGAGTCLEVLRANKRLLLVINDTLMDNHQAELAEQLSKGNYVVQATVDDFISKFATICDTKFEKFPPKDNSKFEEIFGDALQKASSHL